LTDIGIATNSLISYLGSIIVKETVAAWWPLLSQLSKGNCISLRCLT